MDTHDFLRSPALNNIPNRKLQEAIKAIEDGSDTLETKAVKLSAINRYAEANIPIAYWSLKMDRDFVGDIRLKQKYDEYVVDLKASYLNGTSICFAGQHGVGKTTAVTCILKRAVIKGYTALYTTLKDVVSVMTGGGYEDKHIARRELVLVDFLTIDEWDLRFFKKSNDAADLYAQTLEGIFRTRSQNKLPTLMCTNSPNIVEAFSGPLKDSIGSLMSGYVEFFTVTGDDFRKRNQ